MSKKNGLSNAARNTLIGLSVVFFIGVWSVGNYNSLVTSKNAVDKSWATVETRYQRRFDLIGNLVESVKGGQKQELAVFTAIADARKQYSAGNSVSEKSAALNSIETNLALLPRMQEAYPELKSNVLVAGLMQDLKGTENDIATARDTYNTTANNYNNNVSRFPKLVFAKMFGFDKVTLFKSEEGAAKAVKVNL